MPTRETGVLPTHLLSDLFDAGFITGVPDTFLNPASIDLPLSGEAVRLDSIFQLQEGELVRDRIKAMGAQKHNLKFPLEVGVPYLIRIAGTWKLPPSVYGYVNPKSSTGRLNLFSRVVADGVDMYDTLKCPDGSGWEGELWVLVRADSFPILLEKGKSVSQVRLFSGKSFLSELELNIAIQKNGLLFDREGKKIPATCIKRHGDSLMLTLQVDSQMGWECRGSLTPLNYGKIDHYYTDDFFEPVSSQGDHYKLRKGGFYILSTRERIMVPPGLSAELRPIDVRLGEFRSHAAGYIDPGWGYGLKGEKCGSTITLEVIPYEDMEVRDGQTIARIRYEHMLEEPKIPYDSARSNYKDQQGAKLSKHFKS